MLSENTSLLVYLTEHCVFQGSDTPRFRGCYQDSEGTGGSAIQLVGNTQANGDYGVTFDGDDDWAIITAEGKPHDHC